MHNCRIKLANGFGGRLPVVLSDLPWRIPFMLESKYKYERRSGGYQAADSTVSISKRIIKAPLLSAGQVTMRVICRVPRLYPPSTR